MIGLLQVGKGHNVESLANELGITRRTVFRDLDLLKKSDVPIKFDREFQAYHLTSEYSVPPANLTSDEAIAVLVLCQELGGARRMPLLTKASSAARKVAANLPRSIKRQVRHAADAIRIHPPAVNPLEGRTSIYDDLMKSIAKRETVSIRYESFHEDRLIQTVLSPYRLLYSNHSWYVIARSSIHRQVRTFNIGRIRQLDFAGTAYRIPKNFSLERYFGYAWQIIPEPGPIYDVRVRFEKLVAKNVAEVVWHRTQQLDWNKDGTLNFQVRVKGLNEMSWWIMRYGDQAQVLEPRKLRDLVAKRARSMLQRYEVG